jgi:hypothetical protein
MVVLRVRSTGVPVDRKAQGKAWVTVRTGRKNRYTGRPLPDETTVHAPNRKPAVYLGMNEPVVPYEERARKIKARKLRHERRVLEFLGWRK